VDRIDYATTVGPIISPAPVHGPAARLIDQVFVTERCGVRLRHAAGHSWPTAVWLCLGRCMSSCVCRASEYGIPRQSPGGGEPTWGCRYRRREALAEVQTGCAWGAEGADRCPGHAYACFPERSEPGDRPSTEPVRGASQKRSAAPAPRSTEAAVLAAVGSLQESR
jgi:hypothetical protein